MMLRKGRLQWQQIKMIMATAFFGSICGTIAVQFINTEVLSFVIPLVLVGIALYFLISPQPKIRSRPLAGEKLYQLRKN
jgi:uncharacterized membrane protein YfcA